MRRIIWNRVLRATLSTVMYGIALPMGPSEAKNIAFATFAGLFICLLVGCQRAILIAPLGVVAGMVINQLVPGLQGEITESMIVFAAGAAASVPAVITLIQYWMHARRPAHSATHRKGI